MKNSLLLTSLIIIPFTALANTMTDIIELRAKIKETAEEYRLVCTGFNHGTNIGIKDSERIRTDSSYEYCEYLRDEIENDIKIVLELENDLNRKKDDR